MTRSKASWSIFSVMVSPTRNAYGICYRERVALLVSADEGRLPEVWALRHDFPCLAHQNRVSPAAPAQLCLYFESPYATLRSWTPPRFLRRIRWWLERSARGELHPTDQPVESLFFSSSFQLVLPWNFEALCERGAICQIAKGEDRTDGGATYFLSVGLNASLPEKTGIAITINTIPIVSGAVEYDPLNLGALADLLAAHGVDLLAELQAPLRNLVDAQGATRPPTSRYTVLLMQFPICRTPDSAPERLQRRAFILLADPLEMGAATGALTALDGRYFTSAVHLQAIDPTDAWRALKIMPMEVLSENTAEAARRQSGVLEPGPRGLMVGAGTLGSAMLGLWGRSGWGTWTVIDSDYVRPHNLSRHTAFAHHIGQPKAQVVAALHDAVMQGSSAVTPLVGDASRAGNADFEAALERVALVIDASAGLDYPRRVSAMDAWPRHASVFVTPSGNAAVALIEDRQRARRLRTLEAQYYRALLQQAWGSDHLANAPIFWSGASCRDISAVMPYSRLMSAAANLADRLPTLLAADEAIIRVWQRDAHTGGVVVHDVPVEDEQRFALGDLKVYVDRGLQQQLRALRAHALPSETGGILLGYYDLNVRELVLVSALPAPPDSVSSRASFERGIAGLTEQVEDAATRTAGIVQYVGEWHSHPRGASASPSGDDLHQLVHLALAMGDEGLPGLQLIVGEHDFVISAGEEAA